MVDAKKDKIYRNALSIKFPYPYKQGQRVINLLTLWSFNSSLTFENIKKINENFLYPPLSLSELEELEKPAPKTLNKISDSLLTPEILGLLYCHTFQRFYKIKTKDNMWYEVDLLDW